MQGVAMFRFFGVLALLAVTLMPVPIEAQGGRELVIQSASPGDNYGIGETFTIEIRANNTIADFDGWEVDLDVFGVSYNSYSDDGWFTSSGQSVWPLGPVFDEEAGFFEFQRGRAGYGSDGPSGSGLLGTFSVTATEHVTDTSLAVDVQKSIMAEGGRSQNHAIDIPGYTISRFKDVAPSHVNYADIERWYDLGYTSGCGNYNFCPDSVIDHVAAAVFAIKMVEGNISTPACNEDFIDVTSADWFCGWAEKADDDDYIEDESAGDEGENPSCVDGVDLGGDKCWYPNSPITHLEMARILWRAGHNEDRWDKNDGDNDCEDFFSDVSSSTKYCSEIGRLADVYFGLSQPATVAVMPGCPVGQFCPNDTLTRAEFIDLATDYLDWTAP
jgi:hypothetical protein